MLWDAGHAFSLLNHDDHPPVHSHDIIPSSGGDVGPATSAAVVDTGYSIRDAWAGAAVAEGGGGCYGRPLLPARVPIFCRTGGLWEGEYRGEGGQQEAISGPLSPTAHRAITSQSVVPLAGEAGGAAMYVAHKR